MRRIACASFNKMFFNFLQVKHFRKIFFYKISAYAVRTSVSIDADEFSRWESMNANVTFSDDHETTPTAWILDGIIFSFKNIWLAKLLHSQFIWQFGQCRQDQIAIIQFFITAAIPINHKM